MQNRAIAVSLLLTAALGFAGGKDRDWQNGTLLDPVLNHYFANTANDAKDGSKANVSGFVYQQNNSSNQSTVDYYVIETDEVVYMLERVRLASVKPATLVRYHAVKFAVEKSSKVIVLDEEGKEFAMKIVKLAQKKPANEIQAKTEAAQPQQ